MNYGRIALAAVGGTVAYFVTGLALFVLVPQMMESRGGSSLAEGARLGALIGVL
jgi:hypothetical protein